MPEPKSLDELSQQANVNVDDVQKDIDISGTTPEAAIGNTLSLAKKEGSGVSLLSTDNAIANIEIMKEDVDSQTPVEPVKPIEPEKKEEITPEPTEETEEGIYSVNDLIEIGITDFTNFDETGINTGKYRPNEQGWEQLGATGIIKPESVQLAKEQAEFDTAKQDVIDLKDTINAYDVLQDTRYQGQAKVINAQFEKLIKNMEKVNKSRQAGLEQIGLRSGATRYAGSSMSGIIGEEITQGAERIGELERQRTSALLAAQTSYENRQWTKFAQDYQMLKDIKEDERKELDTFTETLLARNKKIEEEEKADKLRTGILTAMDQGFTDPLDILSALQQVGIEADPEDVTKYTNLIENEDLLAGLSGEAKVFEWYKLNNPELLDSMGITNPLEWMKAVGDAGRKATGGGGGGGGLSTEEKAMWSDVEDLQYKLSIGRITPEQAQSTMKQKYQAPDSFISEQLGLDFKTGGMSLIGGGEKKPEYTYKGTPEFKEKFEGEDEGDDLIDQMIECSSIGGKWKDGKCSK